MEAAIQNILKSTPYKENPYFKALNTKQFNKEDFIETQIQFYFAVTFFSRPMAAAASKVPNYKLRLEIVRNIWEEHGEGDLSDIHGHTFTELLFRLGIQNIEEIEKRTLWPATRQFNTTLAGACALDEYLVGVGVLGMIELMFSEISGWIGNGIIHNNWLTEDKMIHYKLHEALDIKHSQDFFDVLIPTWDKGNIDDRYLIEQGLMLGAFTFNQFYENLYQQRQQRLFRDARCLHVRT